MTYQNCDFSISNLCKNPEKHFMMINYIYLNFPNIDTVGSWLSGKRVRLSHGRL